MQDMVSVNEQGMCRCCLGVGTIASSPGGQQRPCPECLGGTIDLINYPPHYVRLTPEPIEVIESWELGYHLGCCVKYVARAGFKEGATALQDLQKARWYLNREIERLEK